MSARRHRCHPLLSALAVCGALAVVSAASTSTAAPSAVEATSASTAMEPAVHGVTIEVDHEMAEERRVRAWVEEHARAVVERRGAPLDPDDEIRLGVEGELFDYRIRIELSRRGTPLADQPDVLVCECGTDEMLEQVAQAIDAGADRLARAKLAEQGAERSDAAGTMEPQPQPMPPVEPVKRRISGMGIAGAVLTGVGGSAVVGGVVMTVVASRQMSNATGFGTNWQPPGVVALVAGGAVLTAGVSLLVADVARCHESDAPRRCRRRSDGLEVGPSLQAGGGGVVIVGRF